MTKWYTITIHNNPEDHNPKQYPPPCIISASGPVSAHSLSCAVSASTGRWSLPVPSIRSEDGSRNYIVYNGPTELTIGAASQEDRRLFEDFLCPVSSRSIDIYWGLRYCHFVILTLEGRILKYRVPKEKRGSNKSYMIVAIFLCAVWYDCVLYFSVQLSSRWTKLYSLHVRKNAFRLAARKRRNILGFQVLRFIALFIYDQLGDPECCHNQYNRIRFGNITIYYQLILSASVYLLNMQNA